MKNFHQNLLILLALSLCGLCAYQWYGQTAQRNRIENLNQTVSEKATTSQGLTNMVKTMDRQIAQMDARITELKLTLATNDQTRLMQMREITRLEANAETLTNEITQYKSSVDKLGAKLSEAYDGIKKQNEAMKELTAQRDDFVQKYNQSVRDRNDIVAKYNDLVDKVEKLQKSGSK